MVTQAKQAMGKSETKINLPNYGLNMHSLTNLWKQNHGHAAVVVHTHLAFIITCIVVHFRNIGKLNVSTLEWRSDMSNAIVTWYR